MPAQRKHREPIVDTAISLFRREGYRGIELNRIVRASGAPKGSVYHYFPKGKPAIAIAAIEESVDQMVELVRAVARQSDGPEEFIKGYTSVIAARLRQSEFRDGCTLTTIMLELAPEDRDVMKTGLVYYSKLTALICELLSERKYGEMEAMKIATLWITTVQGSYLQSKVYQSTEPLETAGDVLASTLPRPSLA